MVTISKASELNHWNPYKVISLFDRDEEKLFLELPGYSSCPILDHACRNCLNIRDDNLMKLYPFLTKTLQDIEYFDSLCLVAVLDTILEHKGIADRWEILEKQLKDDLIASNSNALNDENLLLVETWPLIQQEISWVSFQALYERIESQMHMIKLDHPLVDYAKRILFQIDDFEKVVEIAFRHKWFPKVTKNRLQASQFFLDYVDSLHPCMVGILLEDPASKLKKSFLSQSCLPLACLQLSTDKETDFLTCTMISLYDLDSEEPHAVSTRPPPENCSCFKCQFEKETNFQDILTHKWVSMAQRLAHVYFQEEKYEKAKHLYKKCHNYFAKTTKNKIMAADSWHSMVAVFLAEYKFLKAQRYWKKHSDYQSTHSEIALQLEKQVSYGYFDSILDTNSLKKLPEYQAIGTSQSLFCCPNMLSYSTCRQLITWAQEHALEEKGGWTTNRHYAVPTKV